ncbi:MAG: phosphodiester glycosidase family protein [Clostridia bacterium]|nr:phosphodiester glycosidase family protein [Clostridia bacterium]
MVELTAEEEILVDTLKNRSSEAERMRNYAKQQQTVSASRPTTSQRPVSTQRPSVPPRTPPVRNDASTKRQSSVQQRTPQRPVAPQYNRPVREERSSSQSHYKQVEKIEQKSERFENAQPQKQKIDKTSVVIKVLTSLVIVVAVCVSMYALVIFGNVPFITKWRNIWIETAMTTDQHKWLATSFFPEYLIKEVMDAQVDITDIGHTDVKKEEEEIDILGQKDLVVGEKDKHGNEVLINDIEEGIVVLKVVTSNYVGRLVLIDDPSRVYISTTDYKNSRGEFICDYLEKEDAVIASNASGFHDPGGTSVGGVVTAQCVAQGEYWGNYSSKYITVGFDKDDRLIVGEFSDWEERGLRDAFQYHPALIINGDKVIEGSSGWGLQPRTVIGQAENGVVMIFVVDGRQVGYSLGATMGDCADVLEMYGAVNAGACDGGSSSVLAYEGEILNEPSTNMPTGRYLPNAWVVARKTTDKAEVTEKTN